MSESLREYLAANKSSIDAAVSGIVQSIWSEDDEERDRKGLTRDAFRALKAAISDMLEKGPVEGCSNAVIGSIAISIYRPNPGQELFDRITFQVGRLTGGGAIKRPKTWPKEAMELSPVMALLADKLFLAPPCKPQFVVVDSDGKIEIGRHLDGKQYLFDELPGDEIWLRPMDKPEGGEAAP